jgi:hypothetical protein
MSGWRNGNVLIMLRQCAWCLRLIDLAGERISTQPLPKLYEASHGMCSVCGILWIEQMMSSQAPQASSLATEGYGKQEIGYSSEASSYSEYIAGLSSQQQESIGTPMMVCERNNPYSTRASYPPPEEQETPLEDQVPHAKKSAKKS